MKIQVKAVANENIFFLYAALNACGYDRENAKEMHSVRMKVREGMAQKHPVVDKLMEILENNAGNNYYLLLHEILGDSATERVGNFREVLGGFVEEVGLKELWHQVLPEYEAVTVRTQQNGEIAAKAVEQYLQMPELGVNELIIIPNFLDSYDAGIGPKVDRTAYAILGPSESGMSVSRIQHELLHSIINPLTEDYDLMKRSRLREYIIRAMVLRLNKDNSEYYTTRRKSHLAQGYGRLDDFLVWLEDFEKSGQPFNAYLRETRIELESVAD